MFVCVCVCVWFWLVLFVYASVSYLFVRDEKRKKGRDGNIEVDKEETCVDIQNTCHHKNTLLRISHSLTHLLLFSSSFSFSSPPPPYSGGSESYEFVVQPTFSGRFTNQRISVTYSPTSDLEEQKTGYSQVMEELRIVPNDYYLKATDNHYDEWTIFVVLAVLLVAVPGASWAHIMTSYTHGIPKDKLN